MLGTLFWTQDYTFITHSVTKCTKTASLQCSKTYKLHSVNNPELSNFDKCPMFLKYCIHIQNTKLATEESAEIATHAEKYQDCTSWLDIFLYPTISHT